MSVKPTAPRPRRAERGRVARRVAFALAAVAAVSVVAAPAAGRFFRLNKAHYLANLEQWSNAIAALDRVDPLPWQRDRARLLRAEALLHLGRPFEAAEILGEPPASPPESGPEADRSDLIGIAAILARRLDDAREHFARGGTVWGRTLADWFRDPSPAAGQRLAAATARRFPSRRLYAGAVQWLAARRESEAGSSAESAAALESLATRFPEQFAFLAAHGLERLRSGALDRGCASMLAASARLDAQNAPEEAEGLRREWRAEAEAAIEDLILKGDEAGATQALRSLKRPLGLDPSEDLRLAARQGPRLSPAARFELRMYEAEWGGGAAPGTSPRTEPAGAPERPTWPGLFREADFAPPAPLADPSETWPARLGGAPGNYNPRGDATPGIRIAPVEPRRLSLWSQTSLWRAEIPPPDSGVRARVLLLKFLAEPRGGVGAGFALRSGPRERTGYVHGPAEWRAFDLPLTLEEPLAFDLRLTNDRMPGVDPASGDRNLHLLDAVVVEFGAGSGG